MNDFSGRPFYHTMASNAYHPHIKRDDGLLFQFLLIMYETDEEGSYQMADLVECDQQRRLVEQIEEVNPTFAKKIGWKK